jgi:hypothetical protein
VYTNTNEEVSGDNIADCLEDLNDSKLNKADAFTASTQNIALTDLTENGDDYYFDLNHNKNRHVFIDLYNADGEAVEKRNGNWRVERQNMSDLNTHRVHFKFSLTGTYTIVYA